MFRQHIFSKKLQLLRANAERRELLDDSAAGEQGYLAAVGTEADRLRAAELVSPAADPQDQTCPLCSSELREPDRAVSELTGRLARLREDLGRSCVILVGFDHR